MVRNFRSGHGWRVVQRHGLALVVVILLSIPALTPLFTAGFPKTHDASVHLIRLYLLDEQIRAGNFFPRWLPDLMTGYGYPTFNFYAPFIYLFAEILHLAGAPLPYALTILMVALVVTAGWGMYVLASDLYNLTDKRFHWAGIAASAAYLYTPYLLVNLYVRGALAELLAQALLPWLFWSMARIFTSPAPHRYIIAAAALLGGIALGHNITLLLLPLLLGPYLITLLRVTPLARSEKFRRVRLLFGWSLVAAGITAFFWAPLLAERSFLSQSAFNAPRLEEHVWSLASFLEPNFPYDYSVSSVPFRLGLAQLLLTLGGLTLTRRRSPLWWFWVALGGVATLAATPLILPIWRAIELLSIVQFPWRFLTVVSLATALVTGGIVTQAQRSWGQATLATLVILFAIAGGRPTIALFDTSIYDDIAVDPAIIARYEAGYGAWGAGWHREFLPKWAEAFDGSANAAASDVRKDGETSAVSVVDTSPNSAPDAVIPQKVSLEDVSPTTLKVRVQSDAPTTLRLNQFYFPGWSARIDQSNSLPVYPSTQLGLVTVEVPGGEHVLEIGWTDSWVQNIAEWLSVITLLILAAMLLKRRRRVATVAVLTAALGLALALKSPLQNRSEPFIAMQHEALSGLSLLGYQTNLAPNDRSLLITPFWYVAKRFEHLSVGWRLIDDQGAVVSQIHSAPYYGTQPAQRWQPGTVIRDGYRLPLPIGAPASNYRLEVRIDAKTEKTEWLSIGVVKTPPVPAIHPVSVVFTDPQSHEQVELVGYTLAVNGVQQDFKKDAPPIARPGDRLIVRLYWRALRELSEDYHSFVHLVSHEQQTLTAFDKIPGQEIARPRFWDQAYAESDTYPLTIPANASSGLYYPRIGFYDYDDLERFLIIGANGETEDALNLAPIKITASQKANPQRTLRVNYGDFARLLGYTLTPETAELQPGSSITLTLFYEGLKPAARSYTQFFQLYASELGMAAQIDQPPLRGGNPTNTWQPGEVIAEQVVLSVKQDAKPGEYMLNIGMYDPENGERVILTDDQGTLLPDRLIPLARIQVSKPGE